MKHRSLRLVGVIAASVMFVVPGATIGVRAAGSPATDFSPTPDLPCGAGDKPEAIQGRVPLSDYGPSGRAAQGYTCNA